jgi:hypothetical protein
MKNAMGLAFPPDPTCARTVFVVPKSRPSVLGMDLIVMERWRTALVEMKAAVQAKWCGRDAD